MGEIYTLTSVLRGCGGRIRLTGFLIVSTVNYYV